MTPSYDTLDHCRMIIATASRRCFGRGLANGCVPMPYICAAHWSIDQYDPRLGSSAPKPDMLYCEYNSFA